MNVVRWLLLASGCPARAQLEVTLQAQGAGGGRLGRVRKEDTGGVDPPPRECGTCMGVYLDLSIWTAAGWIGSGACWGRETIGYD